MKGGLAPRALLVLAFCIFAPPAGAQGVLYGKIDDGNLDDANLNVALAVSPAASMAPLALPAAAVAPAAAPAWRPRLPTFRMTSQFRYFSKEETDGTERTRTDSLSSFDIPNIRFYLFGEVYKGFSYQAVFRVSGDNANEFLKDTFFDWKPNAQFSIVPQGFGILMGKMVDFLNPARSTAHFAQLQGPDAPFEIAPATKASIQIVGMRPYMEFWDGRIQTTYQLSGAGEAVGITTNTKNDFRHTVGIAVSPFGKFPIGPFTQMDLSRSPFNINLAYGYTRTYEQFFRCTGGTAANPTCGTSVTNNKDTPANYHVADALGVWQGLFLWYRFITKDAVDHGGVGNTRFNGGGSMHRFTASYAIKTPWGDLVPWYQRNLVSLADRTVLRNSTTTGNVTGGTFDFGGTETAGGLTRTTQFRDHAIGLNLHIFGDNLAIKPHVLFDTLRNTVAFQFVVQHQWFFDPEGKYR
jgi:hypothetical protein